MLSFLHQTEGDAFRWEAMGDIGTGRAHLGEEMPVWMYRLAQYTMRDVLKKRLGHEGMAEAFRDAGYLAGMAFTENMLDLSLPVGGDFSPPCRRSWRRAGWASFASRRSRRRAGARC